MKLLAWDPDKNLRLKLERGVSFEEVLFHIEASDLLDVVDHPNPDRYPGQKIYVVLIDGYIYLVAFVEAGGEIFLKTIIPSRKATRLFRGVHDE